LHADDVRDESRTRRLGKTAFFWIHQRPEKSERGFWFLQNEKYIKSTQRVWKFDTHGRNNRFWSRVCGARRLIWPNMPAHLSVCSQWRRRAKKASQVVGCLVVCFLVCPLVFHYRAAGVGNSFIFLPSPNHPREKKKRFKMLVTKSICLFNTDKIVYSELHSAPAMRH
jgi:hypothetical protein